MLFKELIMKKNILFILILTIILGFVCIIYFGDSEVQMKNSLKKIGYNDEESEKIHNSFAGAGAVQSCTADRLRQLGRRMD